MKAKDSENARGANQQGGFTLIEVLVSVALLAVIVIGLVAMFDQTRRAFNSGVGDAGLQVDARTAMDMIGRDLSQMAASNSPVRENFHVDVASGYTPLVQPLNAPGSFQTNTLEDLAFLDRYNLQWTAIAYTVTPLAPGAAVGTLYRTVTNTPGRLADGVVDFRIRAYDADGILLGRTNLVVPPVIAYPNGGELFYSFSSNAVPAYVELELGILEPRTLLRYSALTDPAAARAYLQAHAAQVHIFRQRITIGGAGVLNSDP